MKKILLLLVTFSLAITFVGCTKEPEVATVTFDSLGGSEVAPVEVNVDSVMTMPDAPTKDGYRFVHWYEKSATFAFDFSTAITADVTLKAHYVEVVTLSFDAGSGTAVEDIVIDKGEVLENIPTSTLEGFVLDYWYTVDEDTAFDFEMEIEEDTAFTAYWDLTTEMKLAADLAVFEENMYVNDNLLYFPTKGKAYKSKLTYEIESDFVSENGVILTLLNGMEATTTPLEVTLTLDGETLTKTYDLQLNAPSPVVIENSRVLDFTNTSTEYVVEDGQLELFYEEGGSVPYVKLTDFFGLLPGFVDPEVDITYTTVDNVLTMSYEYYDEDEDTTYVLDCIVDADENTLTTPDPGFYWAYVYSTETNYGRNISYLDDHPLEYTSDSQDLIYDLDLYNMDIVMHDGEVVVPFYIANQLFVGSAYYNVYYNYDELTGIYLLPDEGSKEYKSIHSSEVTGDDIPVDLLDHTFNMLAFDLDYLYGLKDVMGVDTYYDLLFEMKDELLTTDADDLDIAIRNLLLEGLDEPHTSYGYMSYYSLEEPLTNDLGVYGPRFNDWYLNGLRDVNDIIGDRFGESPSGWNNAEDGPKPDYWFLDDTTVMLSFNGFDTLDIYEGSVVDNEAIASIIKLDQADFLLPAMAGSYFYYYNSSTLDDDYLEILVAGNEAAYVDTYTALLVADGYTLVQEETDDDYKDAGYYTKDITVGEETVSMFVMVSYDVEYDLFYVGVAKELPESYDMGWPLTGDSYSLVQGDSAVYIEQTLENIVAEKPLVENVILDLSYNTGGNVGALYRVLGIITNDAFAISGMDRDTYTNSTYVVDIDRDYGYTHLNWSLLTTKVTFSAANSMTKIFIENDLGPTIGVQTGGGACSITPVLLPNGTAFTTSSNNISAIRTGSGTEEDPWVYTDVEFGVVPDHVIDLNMIYNVETLLEILNGN